MPSRAPSPGAVHPPMGGSMDGAVYHSYDEYAVNNGFYQPDRPRSPAGIDALPFGYDLEGSPSSLSGASNRERLNVRASTSASASARPMQIGRDKEEKKMRETPLDRERKPERQREKATERASQKDRQADRLADRQTDRQADR